MVAILESNKEVWHLAVKAVLPGDTCRGMTCRGAWRYVSPARRSVSVVRLATRILR